MLAGSSLKIREPAVDQPERADPAARDQLAGRDPRRVVAVHERLHGEDAGALGGVDHDPVDVARGQGERLLAQDVLAGLERAAIVHSAWRWFGSGM